MPWWRNWRNAAVFRTYSRAEEAFLYRMRILYIGKYCGIAGGIERYALSSAQALRADGITVDYAGEVTARDNAAFCAGFDSTGTAEQLLKNDYDAVFLHKLCGYRQLREYHRRCGGKLIFVAHDHDAYCMRRHYYLPFRRLNCHCAASLWRCGLCSRFSRSWAARPWPLESMRILGELRQIPAVALSHYMRGNLLRNGFNAGMVRVIHPFVECPQLPPVPDAPVVKNGLRILFCGQLIRGKGVDLLLEAVSRMTSPFTLEIAGSGSDEHFLRSMAYRLGIADRVHFSGWVSQPQQLYAHNDVLAFPSRWQEPFGLSGLEAGAFGLPSVGFATGGTGEWLKDGRNGRLIAAGDCSAMAAAFDELASSPSLLRHLSLGAVNVVRTVFSRTKFIRAIRQLCRKLQQYHCHE